MLENHPFSVSKAKLRNESERRYKFLLSNHKTVVKNLPWKEDYLDLRQKKSFTDMRISQERLRQGN